MADEYWRYFTAIASENRVLTGLCASAFLGIGLVVQDYTSWKAFGTGGTPPTWTGYWRMTKIRVGRAFSSNNLLDASPLSKDGPSYLKEALPPRAGGHPPLMSRTMPQRQIPEKIDSATRTRLLSLMRDVASKHPESLEKKLSHTEGYSADGLYALADAPNLNPVANDKLLQREIAHAHPSDNSLHVWLSQPDARKVIEADWGQRFPLTIVKAGFIMVYAPRDNAELEVVEKIVKAGVRWVAGTAI